MDNYLQKAYCMHDTVRIYAAITTDIVAHAQKIHNLWPSSCVALGRALTMAAIMSCTYKSGEFLNIKIDGDGSLGRITVECTDGIVRGFVQNPGVYLQYNDGRINVRDAVGAGMIEVVKDLHMREPFSSSCEIVSGEIAEDFAYYFAKSEQIPSAVGLGVTLDNETDKVKYAGGFLIQKMPGCKEEDLAKLENRLANIPSCTEMIAMGYSAEDMIREITDGDYTLLETRELKYQCRCSREGFERGLKSLGKKELFDILTTDGKAEIKCNFCNKTYTFNKTDLSNLINEITSDEKHA